VKPRLAIILLLIVLIPLGLMVWLGFRVARGELATVKESIRKLHIEKLQDVEGNIRKVIQRRERELLELAGSVKEDPYSIRKLVRSQPALRQVFVLAKDGKLVHPAVQSQLSRQEEEFLARAGQVWKDQAVFFRPSSETRPSTAADSGWYSWYWGSGSHFVFWHRTAAGRVTGFELDRFRLVADIIAELPDTGLSDSAPEGGLLSLLDARGESLYGWGGYNPGAQEQPLVSLTLKSPLSSWRLAYFRSGEPTAAFGTGLWFNLVAVLLLAAIALSVLAAYFFRESSRELREAGQRVSFVNHVSHELKTPLTNIRMYAELLQESAIGDDPKASRYLEVVVTESVRLSRLINNVLSFARHQRKALKVRKTDGVVDEIVAAVLESFTPSLDSRGIQARFQAGAPGRVQVDPDALGQIVGNLLGNVEKYAPGSGELHIESRREGQTTVVLVTDNGPGIEPAERENVFQPFVRLSSEVSDGVAGTGIGLSIARELARLHGGDLTLEESRPGSTFKLTLSTPE